MTPVRKSSEVKSNRPTIGLLIGRLGDIGYAANVWPGIADVAAERDANLICFVGGALNAPQEFDIQRNVIYDLVCPQNVDGLVAMSGSLGQFVGPDRLLRFYERFRPLPMISIAMKLEGVPSVLVDNAVGMRDAIAHLIEVHGFRRIAFLRGPSTNSEAEERYNAYREVLAGHGLTFDPGLVTEGNFLSPAGAEAVRLFLDERGASFEAVASANDEMALGALAELRRRGKRVPEDICVVGFDDLEEARYAAPPLTTIRQPLYEEGRKAAEMILDRLAGKRVPRQVVLSTELVIRQSCGCFPTMMHSISVGDAIPAGAKTKKTSALRRTQILTEMSEAAGVSAQKADPGWAERLLDSLSETVRAKKSRNVFLLAWDEILRQVGSRGGDVMHWDRVLQVLHGQAPSFLGAEERFAMDPLWRQAESLLGEVGRWAQVYRRMQADRRAFDFMTGISEPLMTAFDIDGLTDVVAEQLPKMGIRGCYLSLYDRTADGGEKTPTEWSRLILAYNEKGRVSLEPGGRRFPSRQLIPQGILPRGKRFAVMLEPLHFRNESQLGFILFAPLQPEVGPLREAFSRQISTALKGAILLQERRQAQETLQESERREREFQKQLQTLLEISNELSRAESVDALCRQAVELGRSRLGFDRLGIWFYSPEPGIINGSFGTDTDGKLTDERDVHLDTADLHMEILQQTRPIALLEAEANLRDKAGDIIGRGSRVHAAMWNGEKVIGFVSSDNLLQHRPITNYDCELLNSFACTLGYLCSRKQAEETLRLSGQTERSFQERLRTLLEVSNELSRAESVDALCRRAVELGLARLGFDRMGIWFHNPELAVIEGSFGTDSNGNICDERGIRVTAVYSPNDILRQPRPVTLLQTDVDLRDGQGNSVGRGMRAEAAMWDGEKTIGLVAVDNLRQRRPITEHDCELLNLFASTLGYLSSRKRTEAALRASENRERRFQERLRTLMEIGNELSRAESADAMNRQAVELGRSRLGFDRLGIWFYGPEPGMMQGSYGTDPNGEICDERKFHRSTEFPPADILHQTDPVALLQADVDLLDGEGKIIGHGARAHAAIWDGEKVIGFISLDNLLRQQPITVYDSELLNSFASTLGYLTSRKQAEDTLRASEQMERRFEERLRTLVEISNELARAESVDELCRQAVELGRSRLDFDRMGIWFRDPDPEFITGSWGTDAQGNLCDERKIRMRAGSGPNEPLAQTHPMMFRQADVNLLGSEANVVGRGMHAQTAMWDGEKTIGLVAVDNLLNHRPITDQDCELLNLYASTLGTLCSRKRAEETLRSSEQEERSFQERLRALLELSNELSRAESVDALCRQAVELGRSRLGIDRLGIWFYNPGPGIIRGSYGTDKDGNTTDEREVLLATEGMQMEILKQTRPIALLWPDAVLRDGGSNELGRGEQAQAAMWNGEKVIGFVSMDNLLQKRPITDHDCELLNLFASSLGYLSSRIQAEGELREYSENLEAKVEERTRALQQAQENLVRQEKLAVLGQLAATVSHEIRNPLATIRVSTTAVEQKVRNQGLDVERSLDRIQRNITRCDTIISELLEYTRMPALNLEAVDMDGWLNRLLDDQILPEGISLRRDLTSGAQIPLDGERFRRVVINLLDNARQAMQSVPDSDRAGKELVVESKVAGDTLVMAVHDAGIGIPPDVLPHIFEPLFSTKGFGVGLGLSIVKGIVEQHGGTIEITSEWGRGTNAVVRLPLIRKENAHP